MRFGILLAVCAVLVGASTYTEAGPNPGTYVVFFDAKSTVLDPEGRKIVDLAAKDILAKKPAHVTLAGEPWDTPKVPGFNPAYSEARFSAVSDALAADGVGRNLITRAPLTDAEAQVNPSGKRRVEIRLEQN
ncbi:MAG: hypothetical protein WDM89_20795 [Rhizomicrobium sp.]